VDEDALGGEALGAVTGDGIAMVEMTMLVGVDLDPAVVVEARGKATVGMDCLDDARSRLATPSDLLGARELNVVAYREFSFCFAIDRLLRSNTAQRPRSYKTQKRRLPVLRPGFWDYLDAAATSCRFNRRGLWRV
jgi:hypothetical protein